MMSAQQSQHSKYGFSKTIDIPYEEAVEKTRAALKEEGFGVLSEIDIKEKLKEKLDVDFRKYVILGACNPPLAYKTLQQEINIGLLLPCNIIVYESGSGESVVAGAPVVSIRPDGFSAVDAYLPPDNLGGLRPGDSALVEIDSHPGQSHSATVTFVGVRAVYPPSWVSTTEVHMTRALPVRVTLDDASVVLPPGTPADVTIEPGSK